jgi:uncharacterized protein YbjT (DUF2867 family)
MYVITGATGNTGKAAAEALLQEKQKVRVLGRSAERLQGLAALGAEPFPCDVTDSAALARAFTGARAVYTMVPPDLHASDVLAHYGRVADSLAAALEQAKVTYAVCLSSFGADKPDKTGPVTGVHALEQRLNRIPSLNVLYLRAGYFMENHLAQIGVIRSMGMMAGPLHPDLKLPMIATCDIGHSAARALLKLDFSGRQTRELLGQRDLAMTEVAHIIGQTSCSSPPSPRWACPPTWPRASSSWPPPSTPATCAPSSPAPPPTRLPPPSRPGCSRSSCLPLRESS